jgi:hypothetical protein
VPEGMHSGCECERAELEIAFILLSKCRGPGISAKRCTPRLVMLIVKLVSVRPKFTSWFKIRTDVEPEPTCRSKRVEDDFLQQCVQCLTSAVAGVAGSDKLDGYVRLCPTLGVLPT